MARTLSPVKAGQRFGLLTVQARAGSAADRHALWRCRCDCGVECVRQSNVLRASATPSCGCITLEINREQATKHGYHGTRTYDSWRSAIERCHNADSKDYQRYGARGVTVCSEWRGSFPNFLRDMGERPEGTSLDRYPNNAGNYEPGNCRWATPTEQARNRRVPVRLIAWRGEQRSIADIAAELGITPGAANLRHKRGKL